MPLNRYPFASRTPRFVMVRLACDLLRWRVIGGTPWAYPSRSSLTPQ
jgi:hypothetical protein